MLSRAEYSSADDLTAYMQGMTERHLDELGGKIRKGRLDEALTLVKGKDSINRRMEAVTRFFGLEKR